MSKKYPRLSTHSTRDTAKASSSRSARMSGGSRMFAARFSCSSGLRESDAQGPQVRMEHRCSPRGMRSLSSRLMDRLHHRLQPRTRRHRQLCGGDLHRIHPLSHQSLQFLTLRHQLLLRRVISPLERRQSDLRHLQSLLMGVVLFFNLPQVFLKLVLDRCNHHKRTLQSRHLLHDPRLESSQRMPM